MSGPKRVPSVVPSQQQGSSTSLGHSLPGVLLSQVTEQHDLVKNAHHPTLPQQHASRMVLVVYTFCVYKCTLTPHQQNTRQSQLAAEHKLSIEWHLHFTPLHVVVAASSRPKPPIVLGNGCVCVSPVSNRTTPTWLPFTPLPDCVKPTHA